MQDQYTLGKVDTPGEDYPHWLRLSPELRKTAREICEDNRGCTFVLLSTIGRQKNSTSELRCNLLPLLWPHPDLFPTSWLRHVFGPRMREVQEIAESEWSAVYRCLDCEDQLETRGRDLHLRRRSALASIVAAEDDSFFVETNVLCELLCWMCKEVHLFARKARIEELCRMEYRAYLMTDEWQTLRGQKLRAVGYRCEGCSKKGLPLDVHHSNYEYRSDERMEDLTVYCRPCHKRMHGL